MEELQQDIADYLSGKMAPEHVDDFLKRIDSDEGKQELYRQIEMLWAQETEFDAWNEALLFSKIQEVKENQRFLSQASSSLQGASGKMLFASLLGKIAVAAVLVIVISGILWVSREHFSASESISVVREVVKSNPVGQKSTIYLPDGSKVILNSASKVMYLSDFGQRNRLITLDGEAYFEVKKDTSPFVVLTGNVSTTALGTSFNISAYDHEKSEVALITGKVAVEHALSQHQEMILTPGEAARFDETSDVLKKSTFDVRTKILWKDGVINFDHTPLLGALTTLERWYGVKFIMENTPPENLYCTGIFKNDYLNNVLESIGFSLKFKYEINQKKVKLKFEK